MYLSNHLFLLQNFKDTDIFEDPLHTSLVIYLPSSFPKESYLKGIHILQLVLFPSVLVHFYTFTKCIHKQYTVILKL